MGRGMLHYEMGSVFMTGIGEGVETMRGVWFCGFIHFTEVAIAAAEVVKAATVGLVAVMVTLGKNRILAETVAFTDLSFLVQFPF